MGIPAALGLVTWKWREALVQEQRASEVVALQLWMRMGGRDEAANELGLAHYIEHMLFKGTPTRPPGSIDTLIVVGGQGVPAALREGRLVPWLRRAD